MSLSLFGCPADETAVGADDDDGSTSSQATGSTSDSPPVTTVTSSTLTTDNPTTSSSTTGEATTIAATSDTGTSTGSDASSSSSTSTTEGACAIDLLFVVDNSGSMVQEQAALFDAIPDFVDDLGDADLHAMVVDVDADAQVACRSACENTPECFGEKGCDALTPGCLLACTVCDDLGITCDSPEPEACDITLGAGVVHPMGNQSSEMACGFSSGARYVDGSREDFTDALLCAAQVGIASSAPNELVMGAMVEAVTAGTDADACNEGFLRDEALLVVVFVTDEDDGKDDSLGNPTFWKLQLEAAKGGSDENIVVLGLFGDNDGPNPICADPDAGEGAEPSPRLRQFVDSFDDNGVTGSVCAVDYGPFFDETAEIIANSCG